MALSPARIGQTIDSVPSSQRQRVSSPARWTGSHGSAGPWLWRPRPYIGTDSANIGGTRVAALLGGLARPGHGAELLHQAEQVLLVPHLDDLAIHDAQHVDGEERVRFVRRGHAHELALVRALEGLPARHDVSLGNQPMDGARAWEGVV